jgi:hypothetical protein
MPLTEEKCMQSARSYCGGNSGAGSLFFPIEQRELSGLRMIRVFCRFRNIFFEVLGEFQREVETSDSDNGFAYFFVYHNPVCKL